MTWAPSSCRLSRLLTRLNNKRKKARSAPSKKQEGGWKLSWQDPAFTFPRAAHGFFFLICLLHASKTPLSADAGRPRTFDFLFCLFFLSPSFYLLHCDFFILLPLIYFAYFSPACITRLRLCISSICVRQRFYTTAFTTYVVDNNIQLGQDGRPRGGIWNRRRGRCIKKRR